MIRQKPGRHPEHQARHPELVSGSLLYDRGLQASGMGGFKFSYFIYHYNAKRKFVAREAQ